MKEMCKGFTKEKKLDNRAMTREMQLECFEDRRHSFTKESS